MRRGLALLAVATVALVAAPTAQADDAKVMQYIQEHNISLGTVALNPSVLPSMTHWVCDQLRAGKPRSEIVAIGNVPGMDNDGVVRAAQHGLCPDTL